MSRTVRMIVLAGVAVAAAAGVVLPYVSRSAPAPVSAADSRTEREAWVRDRDIEFYSRRAEEDRESAEDLAMLAGLYLQRARERGGVADYRRAEDAARRSLAIRTAYNEKTQLTLASALLAQHRFAESMAAARVLVAAAPDVTSYRALLGELQLEMGEYAGADSTFSALEKDAANLAVAPRLARWAEIHGRVEYARRVLEAARDSALKRPDLPREQVAWFHLRIADLELRHGNLRAAARAIENGLAVRPGDPRLYAAYARHAAAQRNWNAVIRYGTLAGNSADIATLALIGDAYAARGDRMNAGRSYARVEQAQRENPEPFNRQFTQYRLEHGRDIAGTLAVLESEIQIRQDVLGYDMLAWALLEAGRASEARAMTERALRLGTRDAAFHYHAGLIARALNDEEGAGRHLREARDINPWLYGAAW
jgi:hypothetical protein